MRPPGKKIFALLLSCLFCGKAGAQPGNRERTHVWGSYDLGALVSASSTFSNSELVVLSEHTKLCYYLNKGEKIVRSVLYQVNSKKGANQLGVIHLPESFDPAFDGRQMENGKLPSVVCPSVDGFELTFFAARRYSRGTWSDLPFTKNFEYYKRIDTAGIEKNEEVLGFSLGKFSAGDLIEVNYEAEFTSTYGSNLFYFNGAFPKVSSAYTFRYRVPLRFRDCEFVLPLNVPDSLVADAEETDKDYSFVVKTIQLKDLPAISYPQNSLQAGRLPHVFADFRFYRTISGVYLSPGVRVYEFDLVRPKNFEWMVYTDTTDQYQRFNNRQTLAVRKFLGSLPPAMNDSSRYVFLRSLCDTLNNFRYISPRQIYLNENISQVYSGEHLLRRRVIGNHLNTVIRDILKEKSIFYYSVNVLDRRFGDHSFEKRAHYAYERTLFAVPTKNSYHFIMPRQFGLEYHLNELPYYFEGGRAAFTGRNFQDGTPDKGTNRFRLDKLPASSFNDNVRSESVVVKVNPDSAALSLSIKESLSGQFSTLLRHLYLGEGVDSTVAWHYYRRCTDKPGARNVSIKLNSAQSDYPFRYTFRCETSIPLRSRDTLDISGWISTPYSRGSVPEVPLNDYYFDFQFTDSYSVLFDFGKKTEIVNKRDFLRKIDNLWYSVESELVPGNENQYLLRIKVVIKKSMLPKEQGELLVQLGEEISRLNSLKLIFRPGA